ncbi:MAG: cation:proton antiporter [Bacteroidota bacterium]
MSLSTKEITIFFLSISAMLLFARGFGELLRKFKQPLVIGEIIAGIILGPTVLGSLFPNLFTSLFQSFPNISIALQGITVLAVTMLMLVSGLEVDLTLAIRQGKAASLISLMGIIFPFVVGFFAAYLFPETFGITNSKMRLVFSLFVGTALSITALPVVARTLMDLNIFKTEIGLLIIASAMFNDLIGWIIFSVILATIGSRAGDFDFGTPTGGLVLSLGIFVVLTLFIGRKIINYILPILERKITYPGGVLNFVLILGFLGAALTEHLGIHAIFGAFIVGITIGDSVHLKEEAREILQQFVTNIFAPLFFVSIGLRVNFIQNFDLQIVLIFLVLAFVGKVIGCGIGAYWGGMNKEDSLAIGFGMNSRGAMEIVLGILAFQSGLIQEKVFVAIVIMALVTSISSAPMMSFFLKRSKKKLTFIELLKPENIFLAKSNSKEEVIKELCEHLALKIKMNPQKIFSEVWKREQQISTGLANHLAIPHARMNIQHPAVAVAIHRIGIDFDSLDGLPAKIIVLLITQVNEPELQLKILADISKKFGSLEWVKKMLEAKDGEELISKLKQLS